jgi:hypothetical protein
VAGLRQRSMLAVGNWRRQAGEAMEVAVVMEGHVGG